MRRIRVVAVTLSVAVALVVIGGVVGGHAGRSTDPASTAASGKQAPVDRLEQTISAAQGRLHSVPGDWRTWASLSVAYLERARVTSDPTWYPKAEEAAGRSLAIRPDDNPDALVAQGALANARHDFANARGLATAAIAVNSFDADAFAVLADAETQLGNRDAATAAVQRLLDLRPGLSGYARASYDLEQHGQVAPAADLMHRALDVSVDRHDIAFCRAQLGDLALNAGDLATADAQYAAGLAADPTSVALQRGRARVAAASGRVDEALGAYGVLTRRAPTPAYLMEYAELLRLSGRDADADSQLRLAAAAHQLFVANGGVDGIAGAALAEASGNPAEALRNAQQEWSLRKHADAEDTLAWALHLSGRDAEALGYGRHAAAAGVRSAPYAYHLGMIELALGDQPAARTHLGQAMQINPYFSPRGADTARRALAGLGAS
jgi:tetratricopeptide (TPR) repeat protein